jgi:hypothetical protein
MILACGLALVALFAVGMISLTAAIGSGDFGADMRRGT